MFKSDREAQIPATDLLSWVFGQAAHRNLDEPIYIDAHDPVRSISAREARTIVKRLIGGLRAHGVQSGDAVCVHAFNNIHYALLYLAIIGSGARYVGTNPAYTTPELAHVMRVSRVKHIIVAPKLLDRVQPALDECGLQRENIVVFDADSQGCPPDTTSWRALLAHDEEMWTEFSDEATARNTVAALLTTSGTTGLPKAAAISHRALVAQALLVDADADQKPARIRRLLSLPQFHAFAGPLMNLSPLARGIPTYIMHKFNLDQYVRAIHEHAITETAIVNPILLGLVALPAEQHRLLGSLRHVWVAGAHLDARAQNSLRDVLSPSARVSQVWGMTEAGWITTLPFPEIDDSGSTGRLLPDFEAKIIDDEGIEVTDDNVHGEFLVRGPSLMNGYLGNEAATAATVAEGGWLRTGDIGHVHAGKFYVYDRVKDMIKVRGWQVSPAEIEAVLRSHPGVADAAALGVPLICDEPAAGEVPRAYIVVSSLANRQRINSKTGGEDVSDAELMQYLSERLAKYKLPVGGILRVDAIPRSAAGKILKRLLPDQQQTLDLGVTDDRGWGVAGTVRQSRPNT